MTKPYFTNGCGYFLEDIQEIGAYFPEVSRARNTAGARHPAQHSARSGDSAWRRAGLDKLLKHSHCSWSIRALIWLFVMRGDRQKAVNHLQ